MNRMHAKGVVKHHALVAAFAEGKIIEYKSPDGNWVVTENPSFSPEHEYRIKREPRRFWRVELDNGNVWSSNHPTEAAAIKEMERAYRTHDCERFGPMLRVVEYIEVMK